MSPSKVLVKGGRAIILLVLAIVMLVPPLLLIFGAIKPAGDFLLTPYRWPDKINFTNSSSVSHLRKTDFFPG